MHIASGNNILDNCLQRENIIWDILFSIIQNKNLENSYFVFATYVSIHSFVHNKVSGLTFMHQTLLMSWENKTKSLTSRNLHSSKDTLQSGEKRGFIGFMPDRLYYGDIAYQIRASKMFSKIGFFFKFTCML